MMFKKVKTLLVFWSIYRKRKELQWLGREGWSAESDIPAHHYDSYNTNDGKYYIQFRTPNTIYVYKRNEDMPFALLDRKASDLAFYEQWVLDKLEYWWYSNQRARSL